MKHLLLTCLVVLFLVPSTTKGTDYLAQASESIVALSNQNGNIYCSGFVIDSENDYIQTALHCLIEAEKRKWNTKVDGEEIELVFANDPNDLAVLQAKTDKPHLKPTTQTVKHGLAVVGLGHAAGLKRLLVGHTHVVNASGVVSTEAAFASGMSGGPVVDDEGNVVSIIQRGSRKTSPEDPTTELDYGVAVGVMLALEGKFWER